MHPDSQFWFSITIGAQVPIILNIKEEDSLTGGIFQMDFDPKKVVSDAVEEFADLKNLFLAVLSNVLMDEDDSPNAVRKKGEFLPPRRPVEGDYLPAKKKVAAKLERKEADRRERKSIVSPVNATVTEEEEEDNKDAIVPIAKDSSCNDDVQTKKDNADQEDINEGDKDQEDKKDHEEDNEDHDGDTDGNKGDNNNEDDAVAASHDDVEDDEDDENATNEESTDAKCKIEVKASDHDDSNKADNITTTAFQVIEDAVEANVEGEDEVKGTDEEEISTTSSQQHTRHHDDSEQTNDENNNNNENKKEKLNSIKQKKSIQILLKVALAKDEDAHQPKEDNRHIQQKEAEPRKKPDKEVKEEIKEAGVPKKKTDHDVKAVPEIAIEVKSAPVQKEPEITKEKDKPAPVKEERNESKEKPWFVPPKRGTCTAG
ncbi:hypothetical protein SKAU_G00208800 [Synaphobranchus kaupii]|uniref:Uncharacterized protein n=1 Tax=Synaphobranchus kaupii TaxID=118154 RepID=A0A9Q1IUU5_SYNKA|nr:hypothetical protein SKAU_G00208800 [Synaphobranchus kaupii]